MAYDGSLKFDTKVDTTGFDTGISKISSLAKTGLKVATGLITGAATAIGGIAAASIQAGQSFEEGMSQVAAVSGATGKDLEALRKKAEEMGAKTKFSATESAAAMNYMAMAGWKTEEMLSGIEGIMSLAAASGEDLATTSDIVTDALTAFGMTAKDSGRFADVLAAASSNANTNVGMMGETFKYVAPVAGALGFSAEDTAVAIGLMANAGIKGSQAGTALRSIFSRLAKPTKQTQTAMDALGISLTDNEGNVKDLNALLLEMREKFSTLTDAQKAEYAALIAGQQGMSGLLSIVNASDADFDKLTVAINNSTGAAEEMSKVMQNNLKGKITILKSALEGLQIKIYDNIEAPMSSAVEAVTDGINKITAAVTEGGLEGAVEAAGGVLADLALRAAEAAPKMINAGVTLIKSFAKGISDHKREITAAAGEIVKALAEGIIDLLPSKLSEPLRRAFNGIAESIEFGGLKKGIQTLATFFGNLVDTISKIVEIVGPALVRILDFIGEHLNIILPIVLTVFSAFESYKLVSGILDGVSAALSAMHVVMNANPYVLVATLLLTLVAAVNAYVFAIDDATEGEKTLRESDEQLAATFGDFGEKVSDSIRRINEAESEYNTFAENILNTSEEMNTLKGEIQTVQQGITSILSSETAQRGELTQAEIETLKGYFQTLDELYVKELEAQARVQEAIVKQATARAQNFEGTQAEYEAFCAKYYKTGEDAVNAQLDLIDTAETTKLQLLLEELEKRTDLSQEEKDKMVQDVIDEYDQKRTEARSGFDELNTVLNAGYYTINSDYAAFKSEFSSTTQELTDEQAQYNADLKTMFDQNMADQEAYWADANWAQRTFVRDRRELLYATQDDLAGHDAYLSQFFDNIAQLREGHLTSTASIYDRMNTLLTDEFTDIAAAELAGALKTAEAGNEISDQQSELIGMLVTSWQTLPDDCDAKGKIGAIFDSAKGELAGEFPVFEKEANKGPDALVNAFAKLAENKTARMSVDEFMADQESGIKEGGEDVNKTAQTATENVTGTVEREFNSARQSAKTSGKAYFDEYGNGITASDAGERALKAAAEACGMTEKEIRDRTPIFKSLAQQMASSGADGFKEQDLKSSFGENVREAVDYANNYLANSARTMYYSGGGIGDNAIAGMGNSIYSGLPTLEKAAVKASATVIDSINNGLDIHSPSRKTYQSGVYVYQGLVEGMYSGVGFLQKAANWVGAVTVSAVQGNTYNQAVAYGYNISIGMANGIYAGASSAINAAAWMASNALAAAKHRLGIHSPSRVFRDEVGEMIPAGIQEGITDAMPGLLQSTKDEMARLTEEMKSAVDLESGTMTVEKTGQMEYEASLAERLAQRNINVTGTVEDDRPMEIHTHLHVGKRELAQEITPEVNHQLYRIDKRENNRGEG